MKTAGITGMTIGQVVSAQRFTVTRADVVRYAGASGDFNPLHYDDTAAHAAGMNGPFAHGMYSAGCLATAVTDFAGVQTLRRFAVRFRAQARLGTTLTSEIVVSGKREHENNVVVDLDCRLVDEAAAVVVSGSATLATPTTPPQSREVDAAPAPLPQGLVGRCLTPAVVTVERGPAQVFASAVRDDSPVYRSADAAAAAGLDGIPVPPTYLFAVANWGAFGDQQPPATADKASLVDLIALLRDGQKGVILHGEQEFIYHRPVRVGDCLHVDGHVESVEHKPAIDGRPGMTVMVVRSDYRSASASLLATARATYLFRPAPR